MSRFLLVALLLSGRAFAADCQLFYATQAELKNLPSANQDIRTLSRALNDALKTSFELLNKIDHATFGIVSAIFLRGHSLDDIKPAEWDKVQITGVLLYQDQPFNIVPIRGATLTFEADGKKQTMITGTQGEFAGHFFELVPYKRLRLFSGVIFEVGKHQRPTLKIPIRMTVDSATCKGSVTFDHVPLEPVSVIAVGEAP